MDQLRYPAGAPGMDFAALLRRRDRWDYSITSNAHSTEVWERAYPCRYETLEVGYPRNDRLASATAGEVAAAREQLGIAPGETGGALRADAPRVPARLPAAARPGAASPTRSARTTVLLVRGHYFYDRRRRRGRRHRGPVVDVSAYPDVEDLYLAADVLLTDYSSAMFDYAVLDRPIVIYAPDWDTYRRPAASTSTCWPKPPGAVATTFDELIVRLCRAGRSGQPSGTDPGPGPSQEPAPPFLRRLDDGRATERMVGGLPPRARLRSSCSRARLGAHRRGARRGTPIARSD